MKKTSLTTLVAAAGIFMGNSAYAPAIAADLGDGCCADLEERVAELEATTARKGNRVVSLQIYGQVNKALLIFDDDFDSDAYIVDNDASGTRIGFRGSAAMKPGWTAGFNLEMDVQDAASNTVDDGAVIGADSDGDFVNQSLFDDPTEQILIRHSYVYIESERLGRVSIGQQSGATDGIAGIVLGNSLVSAASDHGTSMTVAAGGLGTPDVGFGSLDLGDFVTDLDGPRDDLIRYDSPSIYGFILSASWGDDDFWDIALRFQKEWNSVRFAFGVGYQDGDDDGGASDFEILSGSASVMHVPTGIYLAVAAGELEEDGFDDGDYWYAQLGVDKRWLPYGSTTIYGEYGQYNDFVAGAASSGTTLGDFILSSEAERWGFGVVQNFESAAMDIYANIIFYDFDWVSTDGLDAEEDFSSDLSTVMLGARIKF
jgi:predicted porin